MEASEMGFSENFPAMTITRGTNCGLSELGDPWRLGSITTDFSLAWSADCAFLRGPPIAKLPFEYPNAQRMARSTQRFMHTQNTGPYINNRAVAPDRNLLFLWTGACQHTLVSVLIRALEQGQMRLAFRGTAGRWDEQTNPRRTFRKTR
jgi:hypothetical protein